MTANTPNRGYTYPQSSDSNQLWTHFQELATDLDTDVQAQVMASVTTNDPGTVQSGFSVAAAYGATLLGGRLVTVSLDLVPSSTLTPTGTNLANVSCYIFDAAFRPPVTIVTAGDNDQAIIGAQLGNDGNVLLRTASAAVSASTTIRLYWTFVKP